MPKDNWETIETWAEGLQHAGRSAGQTSALSSSAAFSQSLQGVRMDLNVFCWSSAELRSVGLVHRPMKLLRAPWKEALQLQWTVSLCSYLLSHLLPAFLLSVCSALD